MLIILSGLPGTGKTTIARELARQITAVHIRIDTIEQALRDAGVDVIDHGYRVAYALAEDNLRVGLTVIADSVNPLQVTREAWRSVTKRASVPYLDAEIICSDKQEHRRRVETRNADTSYESLPTWADIEAREYHAWDRDHLVVDTAHTKPADGAARILATLAPSTNIIHVRLLNEGTDVWRPVAAMRQLGGAYLITDIPPDDEEWEFKTGCIVHCDWKRFSSGQFALVATGAASS